MRNLMLGTVLAGLLAGPAMADVVTLTDGSKREGKVVREDAREVVLQVVQGRLSAEITFKREEVRSIEKGDRKSTRLNYSHGKLSRMPSSA